MPHRHHKHKFEHDVNKGQGAAPSGGGIEDVVRRRAFQIHAEKGGAPLDNWLEAERLVKKEELWNKSQ